MFIVFVISTSEILKSCVVVASCKVVSFDNLASPWNILSLSVHWGLKAESPFPPIQFQGLIWNPIFLFPQRKNWPLLRKGVAKWHQIFAVPEKMNSHQGFLELSWPKKANNTEHIAAFKNSQVHNMNVKKQQCSVEEENCLLAPCSLVETKQAQGAYVLVWKCIAFTRGNKQFFLSKLTKARKSADSSKKNYFVIPEFPFFFLIIHAHRLLGVKAEHWTAGRTAGRTHTHRASCCTWRKTAW